MERIQIHSDPDNDDTTHHFRDEEEGIHLSIQITSEGLIMDCFAVDHDGNDAIVGTFGMMADEIFEWLTRGSGGMLERTIIDPSLSEVADVAKWADGGTEAQDGE